MFNTYLIYLISNAVYIQAQSKLTNNINNISFFRKCLTLLLVCLILIIDIINANLIAVRFIIIVRTKLYFLLLNVATIPNNSSNAYIGHSKVHVLYTKKIPNVSGLRTFSTTSCKQMDPESSNRSQPEGQPVPELTSVEAEAKLAETTSKLDALMGGDDEIQREVSEMVNKNLPQYNKICEVLDVTNGDSAMMQAQEAVEHYKRYVDKDAMTRSEAQLSSAALSLDIRILNTMQEHIPNMFDEDELYRVSEKTTRHVSELDHLVNQSYKEGSDVVNALARENADTSSSEEEEELYDATTDDESSDDGSNPDSDTNMEDRDTNMEDRGTNTESRKRDGDHGPSDQPTKRVRFESVSSEFSDTRNSSNSDSEGINDTVYKTDSYILDKWVLPVLFAIIQGVCCVFSDGDVDLATFVSDIYTDITDITSDSKDNISNKSDDDYPKK